MKPSVTIGTGLQPFGPGTQFDISGDTLVWSTSNLQPPAANATRYAEPSDTYRLLSPHRPVANLGRRDDAEAL